MHAFTIAFISTTLSLSVCAASIGDPISHLVTHEQHNRHFHNPDFASADLPAAKYSERSGKISSRQPSPLGIGGAVDLTIGGVKSVNVNSVSPQIIAQVVGNAVTNAQGGLGAGTFQAGQVQTLQAGTPQAQIQVDQAVVDAQAANVQALNAGAAVTAKALIDAQTGIAAGTLQLVNDGQRNVVSPLDLKVLVSGRQLDSRDTIRRQTAPAPAPAPAPAAAPAAVPAVAAVPAAAVPAAAAPAPAAALGALSSLPPPFNQLTTRQENIDDQVEDMDFSDDADVGEL